MLEKSEILGDSVGEEFTFLPWDADWSPITANDDDDDGDDVGDDAADNNNNNNNNTEMCAAT